MSKADVHYRLTTDLFYFAEKAPLIIKDKQGKVITWVPNIAQRYMQMRAEDQLKRQSWVRLLLLKGRQQGGSTWVEMRYFHKTRSNKGISTFILTHAGKITSKLFRMVELAYENLQEFLKPRLGKANVNEMTFPDLLSDYGVGTAGNENVGRGATAQLFHGSEVAYWTNAYAIQDGALESIASLPGTEIILESTANGPEGLFYDKCKMAMAKPPMGDYELVFVPWFWQEEYARDHAPDFVLSEKEETICKAYLRAKPFPFQTEILSMKEALRKMAWRRAKIVDFATANGGINLDAGEAKFRSVYPNNPTEAFLATSLGIIRADALENARASEITDPSAPLVAGVDPAGDSLKSDRTVIALRRGRHLEEVIIFDKMTPMRLAGICVNLIKTKGIDMMFIDRGYGEGTIDRICELGWGQNVMGIAFNERPLEPDIYLNKRSEIIITAAKWVNNGGVRIPNDEDADDIHADLACMPLDKETSTGIKYIVAKDIIKKDLGRSPDIYDAFALTFSYPVRRELLDGQQRFRKADNSTVQGHGGPLKSRSLGRRR